MIVKCDYSILSAPFDLHGSLKMHFGHQISGKITFSNLYLELRTFTKETEQLFELFSLAKALYKALAVL